MIRLLGLLLAVAGALLAARCSMEVQAQNLICPTAPVGTNDNRCASTAFVQQTLGQSAATQTNSPNPAGTASTAGVMMGLAGAITPIATGRILFIISGDITNSTVNDGASVQCRWGTGSSPSNGQAATGTGIGNPKNFVNSAAAQKVPFSCQGIVLGLTLGTSLWLDLDVAAITGGTATVADISISAHEF